MSKEDKEIKVTDKRMFTPDGRLREEYSFLEEERAGTAGMAGSAEAGTGQAGQAAREGRRGPEPAPPPPPPQDARRSRDRTPGTAGSSAEPPPARQGRGGREPAWDQPRDERRGQGGGREAPPAPSFEDPAGFAGEPTARLELPGSSAGPAPSFFDLAAMLAEPVAVYLGDLELPDGQSAESLEMARLHIDLLDILRQKTAGNLTAQEAAFLEDLLYRLRVRYVQKRG